MANPALLVKALQQMAKSIEPVAKQLGSKLKPADESLIRDTISSKLDDMAGMIREGGGFTLDPRTGKMVNLGEQRGFMMSPIRNEEAIQVPFNPNITGADLAAAIPESYIPRLQKGAYLGSWVDDGNVYIDPAERYLTQLASLKAGTKSGQLSGANLSRGFGDEPGPFYDVSQQAINDLIRRRAIQSLAGTAGIGTAGATASVLRD